MGPIVHIGFTAALITGAKLAGYNMDREIIAASIIGGVFLDADKAIEIVVNRRKAKKGRIPDITARCRFFHSFLAFALGMYLYGLTGSWIPFLAVLLHIFLDSFVPGLVKDGKHYPSHSLRKWTMLPWARKSWGKVTIGWPITYPPQMNWIYTKLGPAIGGILFLVSALYWIVPMI